MRKIIITGGAGFIGSHLCKTMIERGDNVICVDNGISYGMKNVEPFLSHPNFRLVEHDIINPLPADICDGVDEIYNFACQASPPKYQKDPIFTAKTSVLGILNVLDVTVKNNAKLLHASTSEVYGDPIHSPQHESHWGNVNPIGIRSCYDEGKRLAESLLFDYNRVHKTRIKVVRIFNTYGPNMDPYDGRVITNFMLQALQGKDLTVYGNGIQTRSFCYVDDLVSIIMKVADSGDDFLGPINCGNPEEFTIMDLAHKVLKLTNSRSKIIKMPLPGDDPMQRRPDIALTKEKFNWTPQIKLDEGLKMMLKYFKELGF